MVIKAPYHLRESLEGMGILGSKVFELTAMIKHA